MMENTPLFSGLTEEQRTLIADRMTLESRRAGDLIYQQGRPATALYLIKSGWARLLTDQFAVLANLSAGSLLGDADMLSGRNYSTSAEAASNLSMWVLAAADLKAIFAEHPDVARAFKSASGLSDDQALVRHLRRLEIMAGLHSDQLQEVAARLHPEHFSAGQTVYRRGAEGETLYLVDEGRVQLSGLTGIQAAIGNGGSFGASGFLTGDSRDTDAVALTDVTAWSLNRVDFEELALQFPILALNFSRVVSRHLRESTLRIPSAAPVAQAPQPAQPAAGAAPLTGLNRAADASTSWWGARSRGAKFRLIALLLLLIWLLGVAAPSLIISLLSSNNTASTAKPVSQFSFHDRTVLVALAADLPVDVTPTYTPWPTETPFPTPTFTPTATPTETPIPTPTFTPTVTPVPPTDTPAPPPPVRAAARVAPAPAPVAAAVAVAAAAPSVQYQLKEARRMEPCENRGNHNIFIKVVDSAGNPVDGVLLVQAPADQIGNVLDKMVSGTKGPGLAEFVMWKGAQYAVYVSTDGVNPSNSDIARPLHPNFTDEAVCSDGDGGNTLFHNSFSVVFQKNF